MGVLVGVGRRVRVLGGYRLDIEYGGLVFIVLGCVLFWFFWWVFLEDFVDGCLVL